MKDLEWPNLEFPCKSETWCTLVFKIETDLVAVDPFYSPSIVYSDWNSPPLQAKKATALDDFKAAISQQSPHSPSHVINTLPVQPTHCLTSWSESTYILGSNTFKIFLGCWALPGL